MNNKVIIYLVASAFMLMNPSISLLLAADSTAEQLGIQVETNGTFIMQNIRKIAKHATYKINLKLIKEFENNGKVIAHFAGEKSTYDWRNPNHTKTHQETDIIPMQISELYYQQTLLDNKFTINFGKLSLWSHFAGNNYANDETSEFVTGSFATYKEIIDAPLQTIALALNYAATDSFDIAYAYFTKNTGDFDRNGFNIFQVTCKSSKNGNYRLYGWLNNDKRYSNYKIPNKKSRTWGFGISIDEAITEEIGVFAIGYSGIKKSGDELRDNIISLLWNTGIQIKGSIWSRANDVVSLAVGQIYNSKGLKTEKISYKDALTQIELYYKFALNNHIAISPIVQYFINPNAEKSSNNIFVYGIRTSFAF
ncbi:MAG: carbohydrate porin [Endomicrobium sp.]|nr:carbohydrate porin [Endomicrobium sp.]